MVTQEKGDKAHFPVLNRGVVKNSITFTEGVTESELTCCLSVASERQKGEPEVPPMEFFDAVFLWQKMVPRSRIELPTPAFSGLRSTTELPRH